MWKQVLSVITKEVLSVITKEVLSVITKELILYEFLSKENSVYLSFEI